MKRKPINAKVLKKTVRARLEDTGLAWFFNWVTGSPTEHVAEFSDVSELRGRYKNVKEAHISMTSPGESSEGEAEIGLISLTADKTYMRRVMNLPDETSSFLKRLSERIQSGLRSLFKDAAKRTKEVAASLRESWGKAVSEVDFVPLSQRWDDCRKRLAVVIGSAMPRQGAGFANPAPA
ncbi:MAG: hypothetical protein LRZ85_00220 [Alphaproteobacteria bacterium]|nr:hypothetical protein [Alphaproteobacteria bacterium]